MVTRAVSTPNISPDSILLDSSAKPIPLLPQLAVQVGVYEALVLQQIHYWLKHYSDKQDNDHFRDGKWWVWNSYADWKNDNFPFWSTRQIERLMKKLEDQNLIETQKFSAAGYNQTKWYTLNYEQINARLPHGDRIPDFGRLDTPILAASNLPKVAGSITPKLVASNLPVLAGSLYTETTTKTNPETTTEKETILSHPSDEGDDMRRELSVKEVADRIYQSTPFQEITGPTKPQAEVLQPNRVDNGPEDSQAAAPPDPATPPTPECGYISFKEIEEVYPGWRKDKGYAYIGGKKANLKLDKSQFSVPKDVRESGDPLARYRERILSCWDLRKALPDLGGKILVFHSSEIKYAPVLLELLINPLPPPPDLSPEQQKAGENCEWFRVRKGNTDIEPRKEKPPLTAMFVHDGKTDKALRVAKTADGMWAELDPRKYILFTGYGMRVSMNDTLKSLKQEAFRNAWRGRSEDLKQFDIQELITVWADKGDHDLKGPHSWLERLATVRHDRTQRGTPLAKQAMDYEQLGMNPITGKYKIRWQDGTEEEVRSLPGRTA